MSKYIDEIFASQNEEDNRELAKAISNHFNEKIDGILARRSSLDSIEIQSYEYNTLFMEARELYFQEFYYSCVVMSCSFAEYILRNLFFDNVNINMKHLSQGSQKYLSFIQAKTICEFLVSESIIKKSLLSSFKVLGELHGKYLSISVKSPKEDAGRALYHLHKILNQVYLH